LLSKGKFQAILHRIKDALSHRDVHMPRPFALRKSPRFAKSGQGVLPPAT
jgi:hypothetical protein